MSQLSWKPCKTEALSWNNWEQMGYGKRAPELLDNALF
jgi:hypothetical protein